MMRRSPNSQVTLCTFVACRYTYVLQVYTCLQVEVDHRQGEVTCRSGSGCPPSESSVAKVHV